MLYSDPFEDPVSRWRFGRKIDLAASPLWAPLQPGKIVGIGRSYAEHARELGNEPPGEPILFLKSPGSVIGPKVPIVLPPESTRVEYEGEIALVMRTRLSRPRRDQVAGAVLGILAAPALMQLKRQGGDQLLEAGFIEPGLQRVFVL